MIKTLLRGLSHNYIIREQRNGPFQLQFTDFHATNVFVDDEWNVSRLVVLKWVCSLPIKMRAVVGALA
ncbi:Uncharacterized protein TCAP_02356 [Tolypocladium capitatum]|uniref:Uncharacterized protein n=1 Tax=Tolypocladium capitatum TaxID=45235 RepID=A0A2K3QJN2_9HYPO|nr:Uncharacterized protein TCAP_02356 [Tolypocladium capitatum]